MTDHSRPPLGTPLQLGGGERSFRVSEEEWQAMTGPGEQIDMGFVDLSPTLPGVKFAYADWRKRDVVTRIIHDETGAEVLSIVAPSNDDTRSICMALAEARRIGYAEGTENLRRSFRNLFGLPSHGDLRGPVFGHG